MTDPVLSERLARDFFRRVWAPPHDLDAIDELMTEDYRITTAGMLVEGRANFKAWVAKMQQTVGDATNEHLEVFTNAAGDRIVSRWVTRGTNKGMSGLSADGRAVEFTGLAIWRVRGDRLAECWVERAAYELYSRLRDGRSRSPSDRLLDGARRLFRRPERRTWRRRSAGRLGYIHIGSRGSAACPIADIGVYIVSVYSQQGEA